MSRLQKKCFIGATSLHGLLLLTLVAGPGFFTEKEMPSEPMIEIVTDRTSFLVVGEIGLSFPPSIAPEQVQQVLGGSRLPSGNPAGGLPDDGDTSHISR